MTLHEKRAEISLIVEQIYQVATIEELLALSGKLFYELMSAFDAEQIKDMGNDIDFIVQSLLIPAAQHIGKEKSHATQKEMGIATRDILSLLSSSYLFE